MNNVNCCVKATTAKSAPLALVHGQARALAVAAYTKAIAINPTSQVGKSADQGLKQLPK